MSAKILLVDEEDELRENLTDLLEFKGYEVMAFCTGEELLEQFDSLDVDLALLDIQLPGIDGLQILQIIKKKRPHLPVAMVSASSVRSILARAEALGAERTILKPYSHQDMLDSVQEMLGKSESQTA